MPAESPSWTVGGLFVVQGQIGQVNVLEALVSFLILVIIVIVVAAIVLWAVGKFFPEVYPPARLIVGAVALIVILYAVLKLVQSGVPGMP